MNYANHIPDNIEEPRLVRDLKELHTNQEIYLPSPEDIPFEFFDDYPETEYLANGAHAIVIVHPDDPTKVVSFRFEKSWLGSSLEFLEKYHMHNVLNILYPEHFPKIYSASERTGQMQRERVFPDPIEDFKIKLRKYTEVQNIYRGIEEKVFLTSGIEINLDDYTSLNLMYGIDGQIKYVDLIDNDAVNFNFDRRFVLAYFNKLKEQEIDKEKIRQERKDLIRSLNRIEELAAIQEYKTGRGISPARWKSLTEEQQERILVVIDKIDQNRFKWIQTINPDGEWDNLF